MSLVVMDDVQREVRELQQARKSLHAASVSNEEATSAADGSKKQNGSSPSSSSTGGAASKGKKGGLSATPRTLDAPSLSVLKSANYPFSICEEAPASYAPPPVPFDVLGEIELMKEAVMRVQETLDKAAANGSGNGGSKGKRAGKSTLSEEEVLQALEGDPTFAELAWQISSMQWFYRWVLTHSIAHLWNVKEALEYVLTDGDAPLPASQDEMDFALAECAFPDAVNVLDSDRMRVVAQERSKLQEAQGRPPYQGGSLPSIAVTATASSYLTDTEKIAYQEYFNQSEHLLLLLNHAVMMDHAEQLRQGGGDDREGSGKRGKSATPGPRESGALITRSDTQGAAGHADTQSLADATRAALADEKEVISAMLSRMEQRKKDNVRFELSEEEARRSRTAQVAVYGCVLSDMNIMGREIDEAATFFAKYNEWLQFHGLKSHDALMKALSQRAGGARWPVLAGYAPEAPPTHTHFVPPTQRLSEHRASESAARAAIADSSPASKRKQQRRAAAEADYTRPARTSVPSRPAAPAKASGAARPRDGSVGPQRSSSQLRSAYDDPNNNNNKNSSSKAGSKDRGGSPEPASAPKPHGRASASAAGNNASAAAAASSPSPPPSQPKAPRRKAASADAAAASPPAASAEETAEQLSDALVGLLAEVTERYEGDEADGGSGLYRAWQAVALHYTSAMLCARRWEAPALLAAMPAAAEALLSSLQDEVADAATATPYANALVRMLRELAGLVDRKRTSRKRRGPIMDVLIAVHVPFGGSTSSSVGGNKKKKQQGANSSTSDLAAEAAYALTAIEQARWLAVADALWLQCDPTRAASGGMLNKAKTSDNDSEAAVGFLRVESVTVPARPAGASAESDLAYLCLHYLTAVGSVTVGTLAGDSSGIEDDASARAAVVRRTLETLRTLERRGFLAPYACRVAEAGAVPLSEMLFTHLEHPRLFVSAVPPPAVELCRIDELVGTATTLDGDDAADKAEELYADRVNFCTVALAVADVIAAVAEQPPLLTELYMLAETVREQALYEIRTGAVPRPFARAVLSPIEPACDSPGTAGGGEAAAAQEGGPTTQRNRNRSTASLVQPLLAQLDDQSAWAAPDVPAANVAQAKKKIPARH